MTTAYHLMTWPHALLAPMAAVVWDETRQSQQCLALTGKAYDPNVHIQGGKIQFGGKQPIRFLGGTI